jgi:cytochrome c oxidase cbb3-type subunit 1
MNPYFLMVILYLSLAVLAAFDSAFAGLHLTPWFNGLRWLSVHFITLGAITQALFGLLPGLVSGRRTGRFEFVFRWDIWIALNAGLVLLLIGIPLVNASLVISGGTLIFIAVILLIQQIRELRPAPAGPVPATAMGKKFYLVGLAYLLLGIIVGSGLWFGWVGALHIAVPLEVHIHANNWGFLSLVFAGLLVDLYPHFAGRSLAWPRSVTPIFWMMTAGALGLVLGPWLQLGWFTVPGLLLHLAATLWLLLNVIKPLIGERRAWTPGILHLVTAYVWILAPVLVAPLVLLKLPGFPGTGVEQNAPQALIYGWALQFGLALIPYFFYRIFLPERPARLGGSWLSLIAVHAGSLLLWASIFSGAAQPALQGVAYLFWSLSMLLILAQLIRILNQGSNRSEKKDLAELAGKASSAD